MRWTAPCVSLNEEEAEVWARARDGALGPPEVRQALRDAHDAGARLSPRSLACLPMGDGDQLAAHVARCAALAVSK